jgi:uncharacterized OB-fold protein
MSFPAMYRSACAECGGYFEPGTLIKYQDVRRARLVHDRCPDDPDLMISDHPICPRCTARHPGEC